MRIFVLGNFIHAHFVYVDRLPQAGESCAARRVFQEHGGKGLNLGVGLHRLGAQVAMLMAVGADAAGAAVKRALLAEGMDVQHVLDLGESSGFGVGFIAPAGGNFLAAHLGANALLAPGHVDAALEQAAAPDWVMAHFEVPVEVVRHAFGRARACGARTYLNPSPWMPLDAATLALIDVLVVNETEAAGLFECDGTAMCTRDEWAGCLPALAARAGWRGEALVVTLGAAGSVALARDGTVHSAPAPAIEPVDATGAGDAFGCGLVWSLARGSTLAEALHVGNACGAYIAAREGVFAHLPRPAELALRSA